VIVSKGDLAGDLAGNLAALIEAKTAVNLSASCYAIRESSLLDVRKICCQAAFLSIS
jgi:hypothetical protein